MSEFKPIELTAMTWHEVSLHGWVATFTPDAALPEFMWDARNFRDMVVSIDGDLYHIIGVEQFATMRGPRGFNGTVRRYATAGDGFGLLVDPIGHKKHARRSA